MFKFNKKFISCVNSLILSSIFVIPLIANALNIYNDPNGDGSILLNDAVLINQYLSGGVSVTNLEKLDFDNDGIISKADAFEVQLYNLGLLNSGTINSPLSETYNGSSYAYYRVFDASTGDLLINRTYVLYNFSPIPNNVNEPDEPDVVIGDDGRVPLWDKSGVVKIITDQNPNGVTGFVVGPHIIATAAHCVYNDNNTSEETGQIINSVKLFNSNGVNTLTATPVEYHVPYSYINLSMNYPRLRSNEFDYALLTVEEDLSDYMCFNLGVALNNASENHISIKNTGFPHEVNGNTVNTGSVHNMYMCTGNLMEWSEGLNGIDEYNYYNLNEDRQLYYDADTSGGNSGGPVYVTKDVYDKNGNNHQVYYDVIAIHVSHTGVFNVGTRINGELLHFYLHNTNPIY